MHSISYLNDFPESVTKPDIPVTVYPLDEKCPDPDPNSNPVNHEFPLAAEEYFMAMACLAARRSKDPARQVYIATKYKIHNNIHI